MPAWPSFLPIIRGLVQYVSASATSVDRIVAGLEIAGRLPLETPTADSLRVEQPNGNDATVSVSPDGEWAYRGANKIGVYRLLPSDISSSDASAEPLVAIAVNADPTESHLRRVALDRLPDSLVLRNVADSADASATTLSAPASLHRWLLQAALALVLIDTALACYFGRGGGA